MKITLEGNTLKEDIKKLEIMAEAFRQKSKEEDGEVPNDEKVLVANTMIEHGGSFVSRLGKSLLSADWINTKIIKDAFGNYWDEYKKIGEDKLKMQRKA